jgi:hypothetical protein
MQYRRIGRAARALRLTSLLFLGLIALSAAPTGAADGDGDPGETGESPRASWRFVTGGTIPGSPTFALGSGLVYAAADDRYLYAIGNGGELQWRHDLERRPTGPAVVGPLDTVYVPLSGGTVVGVAPSGNRVFTARAGADAGETGGRTEASREPRKGAAQRSDPGRKSGSGRRSGSVRKPAAVTGLSVDPEGIVYVAHSGGLVAAYAPSGTLLWRSRLTASAALSAGPVVGHPQGLILGDAAGGVTMLSGSGKRRFRRALAEGVAELAVSDAGTIFAASRAGTVTCFGLAGQRGGSLELDEGVAEIRAFGHGEREHVVILGARGELRYYRTAPAEASASFTCPATGEELRYRLQWRGALPEDRFTAVAVASAGASGADTVRLLLGTERGALHVLNGEAAELAQITVSGESALRSIAVGPAGRVLISSDNWVLYGFASSYERLTGWVQRFGTAENRAALSVGEHGAAASESSFNAMYYRELLRSEYPEDRERAMAEFRERIRTGALRGSFETIRDVLRETAFAVFRRPVYRDGELVNDYPELRAEAARLLGAIGGVEEQEAFARLLLLEYEWSVRTEIVSAMGRIGADPDGSVSRAIYGAVRELRPNRPQERFARAVLQTFSTFLRYHRAPPDPAVFESLERLREMDLSRSLRRRAHELLSSAGS